MRPSLAVIMNRNGTDKLWAHHYEDEYERHFASLRDKPIRLLEIGIGGWGSIERGGESLKSWRDYFPNASIVGLDIEDKKFLDCDRITTVKGNQSNIELLNDITYVYGPFDIVIDDGSHIQSDILTTFKTLFPLLKPGGIYIIEDLETAYREKQGGHPEPFSRPVDNAMAMIANLIDGMHSEFWVNRIPASLHLMVQSVHVSTEIAFIYKKQEKTNRLVGYRESVMAGAKSL